MSGVTLCLVVKSGGHEVARHWVMNVVSSVLGWVRVWTCGQADLD